MEPKPGGWQFVNFSEPTKQKKNEEVRRTVRANAMRDFRKKQKQERQASSKLRNQAGPNQGRPLHHLSDSTDSSASPESVAALQLPDDAEILWPDELSQILGDLDIVSLDMAKELSVQAEEDLVRQAEGQFSHPQSFLDEDPDDLDGAVQISFQQRLRSSPRTLLDAGNVDQFNSLPGASLHEPSSPHYNAFVLHHFATVVARNCLPIDPGAGENPLTKIWLPYAVQDPALFSATITFAAVHLDLLIGRRSSQMTFSHKSNTIKAINQKIQSSEDALSNFTIGAVAMVAAMESLQGNLKELRIHMNALTKMVGMRGGLQKLGWSGVLHMWISWQDLLYSSMIAQPPAYPTTPCCIVIPTNVAPDMSLFSDKDIDAGISSELRSLFCDLKYLTKNPGSRICRTGGGANATTLDLMIFSKTRSSMEFRILEAARSNRKAPEQMTSHDFNIAMSRLAALVYIKCALHMFLPVCGILSSLKAEAKQLIQDAEAQCIIGLHSGAQPLSATWSLIVCSVLSATPEEEEFFAIRIAKGTRTIGTSDWNDMEAHLRKLAWTDKLCTPVCKSVWAQVQSFHEEGC